MLSVPQTQALTVHLGLLWQKTYESLLRRKETWELADAFVKIAWDSLTGEGQGCSGRRGSRREVAGRAPDGLPPEKETHNLLVYQEHWEEDMGADHRVPWHMTGG